MMGHGWRPTAAGSRQATTAQTSYRAGQSPRHSIPAHTAPLHRLLARAAAQPSHPSCPQDTTLPPQLAWSGLAHRPTHLRPRLTPPARACCRPTAAAAGSLPRRPLPPPLHPSCCWG